MRTVAVASLLCILSPAVRSFQPTVPAMTTKTLMGTSCGTSPSSSRPASNGNPLNKKASPAAHGITTLSSASEDDMEFEVRSDSSFRPETSFGAEAVPEEQRPANEYLDLIRQPLFGWASQEKGNGGLALRLAVTYAAFFAIVCYPIAGATYTQDGYLLQKLAASNVGAVSVLLVVLIRLFSGWGYVGSRLQSKVIEYEETGWYDGDIELKTEAEKARDMFLYRSDVKPVEDRLKLFAATIGGLWLASIVGFNVALANKPLFNEYDPEMLKTLTYDDKIANVAAQQSGGVPTYCNSRYYRAIANGGQGCK